jgi:thioesterase domain-containing protein
LIFPGFYGWASNVYRSLGEKMDFPTYIVQYMSSTESKDVEEIVDEITPHILELFSDVKKFILIGHSFGTILSLRIAKILEDQGKSGKIVQLDGSPKFTKDFALQMLNEDNIENTDNYISMLLFKFYQNFVDSEISKAAFESDLNWKNRFKEMTLRAGDTIPLSREYMLTKVSSAYINRLNIALNLKEEQFAALSTTKIALIKAAKESIKELPNDYGLSQFSSHNIIVKFISGDHVIMLQNSELPIVIKEIISA